MSLRTGSVKLDATKPVDGKEGQKLVESVHQDLSEVRSDVDGMKGKVEVPHIGEYSGSIKGQDGSLQRYRKGGKEFLGIIVAGKLRKIPTEDA